MESIPKDSIFEFNPDTLVYLRKQYGLDEPGRIEQAIDILEEWIQKQNHFTVRKFREYAQMWFYFLFRCYIDAVLRSLIWYVINKICLPYYYTMFKHNNKLFLVILGTFCDITISIEEDMISWWLDGFRYLTNILFFCLTYSLAPFSVVSRKPFVKFVSF